MHFNLSAQVSRPGRFLVPFLLWGLMAFQFAAAQGPQQVFASDKNYYGDFGNATAIAGDYAAIGATRSDNWPGGAVYIFKRSVDGTWTETQKIAAPPESYGSYFGIEVDMDGEYMAATNRDGDQVFVYKRNASGIYEQTDLLEPSVPSNEEGFGHVIKIFGDQILVGAPFMDVDDGAGTIYTNAGAAFIFQKDAGENWTQIVKLTPETLSDHQWYGIALTATGNELFIGAERANNNKGGVYRYDVTDFQNPQYLDLIIAPSFASSGFGRSLASYADKLLVGEPFSYYDENDSNYVHGAGAAHLFTKAGDGSWTHIHKILAPQRKESALFGLKVELSADFAAFGSEYDAHDEQGQSPLENAGGVFLFVDNGAGHMEFFKKVVAPQRQYRSHFASDIALQNDELLVGSYSFSSNVQGAGTAYFFTDFTAPEGYAFQQVDDIEDTNQNAYAFTFTGGEIGATAHYRLLHSQSGELYSGQMEVIGDPQSLECGDLAHLPDGSYSLELYLSDPSGNQGPTITTALQKETTPTGYILAAITELILANNESEAAFSLENAEVGTTCHYTFTDQFGNTIQADIPVSSQNFSVSPIDLSTLSDGPITFSAYLQDNATNQGENVTASIHKDTQAPTAYTIASTQQFVNLQTVTSYAFSYENAEAGAQWSYRISSDGGAGIITDTGVVTDFSGILNDLDLSGVEDGQLTLEFWLTDQYGQVGDSVSLTFHKDTLPPQVACKAVNVALDNVGQALISPVLFDDGSADESGVASLEINLDHELDCTDLGNHEVLLTAIDKYGNSASCSTTLQVQDNLAPEVELNDITVALGEDGTVQLLESDLVKIATDNCSAVSLEIGDLLFDCSDLGSQLVEVRASDNSGNEITVSATVSITDESAPQVATRDITVELDANGQATLTVEDVDAGSIDNCGLASLQLSQDTFSCQDLGLAEINLTAADSSGNQTTAVVSVEVVDRIAPEFTLNDLTVSLDAQGQATIVQDDLVQTISDNCGATSVEISKTEFNCEDIGSNTITVLVSDESGNLSEATAQVTIQDTEAPMVAVKDIVLYLDANGEAILSPDMVNDGSTDNCGIESMYLQVEAYYCGDEGIQTNHLLVSDSSGNLVEFPFQVEVVNDYEDVDMDEIPDNCDPEIKSANTGSESAEEEVDADDLVKVAEAFSPNGDGINDTWNIVNVDQFPGAIVTVYNRWGAIVFQARGYRNDWDGSFRGNDKLLPESSTYYYQIDLDADGSIDKDGWIFIAD